MAGTSPVQRTMKYLRDQGQVVWVVERWMPVGKHGIKMDLLNIIDILAIDAHTTTGIQACGSDFAAHIQKLTVEKADETITWLSGPRELHLYGWRKVKLRPGAKAMRWRPRIAHVMLNEDQVPYWVEV